MACGMPILAAASGETKRIIEEAQCGVCSKIGDSESLADSIKSLMNADTMTMSINSRDYFISHFEKKKLMDYIDKYFIR